MKIALLSDVHSNLHALKAVLEHVEEQAVDRMYCLGDVVGYNAFPLECVEILKERADHTILGNHDWAATLGAPDGFNPAARAGVEYARKMLTKEAADFLASCQPRASVRANGTRLDLFHASPREPLWEYIFPDDAPPLFDELLASMKDDQPRFVALGHTHVPILLSSGGLDGVDLGDFRGKRVHQNLAAARERPLVLLNPGSVGQPRDGDPRAAYAVVDTEATTVRFHRVEYDVAAAARAVREAGLPDVLAERLFRGR